jgi:mannose-1-phosphate guanylyltransferase
MQVMILAAGRSERLLNLGRSLPKPLLPMCGHPAITFLLALCRDAGLTDIVVNLHHHSDRISKTLGDGSAFGVRIRYSYEEALLGAGAGLRKARSMFQSGPLLLIYGGVTVDVDLNEVLAAHRSAPAGTLATMVLREEPDPELWPAVTVNTQGRVLSIRGQHAKRDARGHALPRMFTGIQVVEPDLLDRLPENAFDWMGDALIPALLAGELIWSTTITGYFSDNATPERYLASNLALVGNSGLLARPPGPLQGVDPAAQVDAQANVVGPVRIAAGAIVEGGATVGPSAVVCGGGRVARGSEVIRSVVWPGGVAQGRCESSVVMPDSPPFPIETRPEPRG